MLDYPERDFRKDIMPYSKYLTAFGVIALAAFGLARGASAEKVVISGTVTWNSSTPTTAYTAPGGVSVFSFEIDNVLEGTAPGGAVAYPSSFSYTLNGSTAGMASMSDVSFSQVGGNVIGNTNTGMFAFNFNDGGIVGFTGADIGNVGSGLDTITAFGSYPAGVNWEDGNDTGTTTVNVSPAYVPLPLDSVANIDAIANAGQPVSNGGLDEHGYALPEALLGATLTASGTPFPLLSASSADAVWGATLQPTVQQTASALQILALAANGSQLNQQILVTYTDQSEKVFTQSFSDWGFPKQFPGESIATTLAYRVTPTGTTEAGAWHVYEYSFPLDPTRQVLQVTLPQNRNVAILSATLDSSLSGAGPVQLASQLNSYGLSSGGPSANPGLDGHSYDYPAQLLGSTTIWSGIQFQIPQIAGNGFSTIAGTVYLPYGSWSNAYILATGFNGPQPDRPVVVTYDDGSTQTVVQSFSDWGSNQHYAGEGVALTLPYRYRPDGTKQAGTWNLYGYSFALDPTKSPVSISVQGDVKILALSMLP
jgi:hypothetical protein